MAATSAFVVEQPGDAAEFVEIVQSVAIGLVRESKPKRLYVIRIDNWFGPKWLNFSGKFSVARGRGFGVHKTRLHVPPFVPSRVISERLFAGPDYSEVAVAAPLHIECASRDAMKRRIEDIDQDAAFLWFSSESEEQQRGAVMAYSPAAFLIGAEDFSFYAGLSKKSDGWQPSMLRHISRGELEGLQSVGIATLANAVD